MLLVTVTLSGYGIYYYFYGPHTAYGILTKYENVTGATQSIISETFSIKGTAELHINVGHPGAEYGRVNATAEKAAPRKGFEENLRFEVHSKKPDKFAIDYFKDGLGTERQSVMKQVFDGAKGWRLRALPNQSVEMTETNDPIPEEELVLGEERFVSVDFLSTVDRKLYGEQALRLVETQTVIDLEGKTVVADKFTTLKLERPHGKRGYSDKVLVFDQVSGLMTGSIQRMFIDNKSMAVVTNISKYKSVLVKVRSLLSGAYSKKMLIPSALRMRFINLDQKPTEGVLFISIDLEMEDFQADVLLEDSLFAMPVIAK